MAKFDLKELGAPGLERYAGEVFDEQLPELRGRRGRKILKTMAESDAVVGALLFAVEMLCRQVTWDVAPASESSEDEQNAEFIEGALFTDLDATWPDQIAEILSFLQYGWAFFEIVYKVRNGETSDLRRASRFNDGRIGWRKWSIRGQESLSAWHWDEAGELQSMEQQPPPDFLPRTIPLDKGLLFRTSVRKGNPEGFSAIRRAYTSWYFKSNIQRIEGIGIERDLAGLPVAYVPPELLNADATSGEAAILAEIKKIVTNIRRDEQEGVIFPLIFDANGNQLYKLELLTSGGRRQFDTDAIIARYDQRILMTVLADFILLGHEKVGSYSLSADKTNLFSIALCAWLDSICEVINRFAIPKLLKLNGIQAEKPPQLTHGDVESVSLTEIAEYVSKLSAAGIPFNNAEVATALYEKAKLPVPVDGFESIGEMDEAADESQPKPKTKKDNAKD